jgi:hypothetical protein
MANEIKGSDLQCHYQRDIANMGLLYGIKLVSPKRYGSRN